MFTLAQARRFACILLGYAALGIATVRAQPRPAVVELFTSEGCSSCPPAEAYLGELARRPDVIALAFHVDYWDDLGWRDRFGMPEAARRQRVYAGTLRLPSPYTPQAVIDGEADYVGGDRAAIAKALTANREGVALALNVEGGEIRAELAAARTAARSDVVLVGYQRQALSAIGRGENSGRTLTEFNIVRVIRSLGSWDGGARRYVARVDSLPADVTDVAVLVQSDGQGRITGAAARSLR